MNDLAFALSSCIRSAEYSPSTRIKESLVLFHSVACTEPDLNIFKEFTCWRLLGIRFIVVGTQQPTDIWFEFSFSGLPLLAVLLGL